MIKEHMQKLQEAKAEEKRGSRVDYSRTAFFLAKPFSTTPDGPLFRIKDGGNHREIVESARKRGLYLWHYDVIKTESGKHQTSGPPVIDWDSVPGGNDSDGHGGDKPPGSLTCPRCGRECSTTSGLTLHLKTHEGESEADAGLRCDVCGKKCSSTSGLTLHKKTHGDGNV